MANLPECIRQMGLTMNSNNTQIIESFGFNGMLLDKIITTNPIFRDLSLLISEVYPFSREKN